MFDIGLPEPVGIDVLAVDGTVIGDPLDVRQEGRIDARCKPCSKAIKPMNATEPAASVSSCRNERALMVTVSPSANFDQLGKRALDSRL